MYVILKILPNVFLNTLETQFHFSFYFHQYFFFLKLVFLLILFYLTNLFSKVTLFWGAAYHRGSILVSHPVAQGLIPSVPEIFFIGNIIDVA